MEFRRGRSPSSKHAHGSSKKRHIYFMEVCKFSQFQMCIFLPQLKIHKISDSRKIQHCQSKSMFFPRMLDMPLIL